MYLNTESSAVHGGLGLILSCWAEVQSVCPSSAGTGQLTLNSSLSFSLQTPLTTSDILLSKTSSPGVLDELPGKGGKFEASKSNFGVGTFASAVEGWGL